MFRWSPCRDRMLMQTQGNAIPLQLMHAWKPDQALGLRPSIYRKFWSRLRVGVGSSGPECCVASASSVRTAQRQSFPSPNPHRICRLILNMCRHIKAGVLGCVREMVCAISPLHHVFSNFLPPTTPILNKRASLEPENSCSQRSGNGGVTANLCLEEPIWPPLPKEGVTQWWGRPPGRGIYPGSTQTKNLF